MEKFRFKLQKILDYKMTMEDIKKSQYGKAKGELEKEEEKLDHITTHRNYLNEERNQIQKTTITEFKTYNNYLKNVNAKLKKQKSVVNNKHQEAEKAKALLVDASKEKKIFEKLKEKKYHQYAYIAKKEEDKITDQIVCFNSSRR